MERNDIYDSLNNCVEILSDTFGESNLHVIRCNLIDYDERRFDGVLFGLEIEAIDKHIKLPHNVSIKIAAFDENDNIIGVSGSLIKKEDFNGYDVIEFHLRSHEIAIRTKKIKLFAMKKSPIDLGLATLAKDLNAISELKKNASDVDEQPDK